MPNILDNWAGFLINWKTAIANIPAAIKALGSLKGTTGQIVGISATDADGTVTGLTAVEKTAGGGNGSGENVNGGMNATASELLITILRNVQLYSTDQSANITALANVLESSGNSSGGGEDGGDTETITYTITNNLTDATNSNAATTAERNTAYTATLTAADGYVLDYVTVTMGGGDITDSVYVNGVISIPAVTGDVVITASAVVGENTSGYANLFDKNSMIITGGFAHQNGYVNNSTSSKYAVVPVEAGKQYALHGWDTYSTTKFGAVIFSSDDDFTERGKEYYIKPVGNLNGLYCYDSSNAVTDAFTAVKDTTGVGITFTVPAGMDRIAVSVCINGSTDYSDTIMLEAGDTCHDYVPYTG